MLWHYLTTAIRQLLKQKGYSFINIAGLAVGLASCILILLYVQDELSYDRFHGNADRIYRIVDEQAARTPVLMGPTLKENLPEVDEYVRLKGTTGVWLMRTDDREFLETNVFWSDPSLFDLFDITLTQGDPTAALNDPYAMIITEDFATKYFGNEDPIGKSIRADNVFTFHITGVMRRLPVQSHITMDMVVSLSSLEQTNVDRGYPDHGRYLMNNWLEKEFYTYLLLAPAVDIDALPAKIQTVLNTHGKEQVRSDDGRSLFRLQPLTSIHLYSHLLQEIETNGSIATLRVLVAVALFLLVIACMNFMNLTTAHALHRAREVGMRKVVGAGRGQLIRQFIGESCGIALLALALAVGIVEASLEAFNTLAGKQLTLELSDPAILSGLLILTVLVGVVSGSYPAFVLSSYRPIGILRSTTAGGAGVWLRKVLVVSQFVIAMVLISGMIAVSRQLDFMRSATLGFDKEHILATPIPVSEQDTDGRALLRLRERFLEMPGVLAMSMSNYLPGRATGRGLLQTSPLRRGDMPEESGVETQTIFTMWEYLKTLDLQLAAGRDFDFTRPVMAEGVGEIILNETAVARLGWQEASESLGQMVRIRDQNHRIVGVVRDFHVTSLHREIGPLAITIWNTNYIGIRLHPANMRGTLAEMTAVWEEIYPDYPFAYSFLDEDFDRLYRSEERLERIVSVFTALTIAIACLGLLGLVAFTTERRTKEIGIRKVLGASPATLVVLLSKTFTGWVLLAGVLASPLAYLIVRFWLQGFAYRVDLSLDLFLYAYAGALALALLTVAYHVIRAASGNPVNALRYE